MLLGADLTHVSGASGAASMPASLPVVTGSDCGVFGGAAFCSGISAGVDAAGAASSVNGARALELEHAASVPNAPTARSVSSVRGDENGGESGERVDRDGIGNAIF